MGRVYQVRVVSAKGGIREDAPIARSTLGQKKRPNGA